MIDSEQRIAHAQSDCDYTSLPLPLLSSDFVYMGMITRHMCTVVAPLVPEMILKDFLQIVNLTPGIAIFLC